MHAEHFGRAPSHYGINTQSAQCFPPKVAIPYPGLAISARGTRNNRPAPFRWPISGICLAVTLVVGYWGAECGLRIAVEPVAVRDWMDIGESPTSHYSPYSVSFPDSRPKDRG